MAGDPMTPAEQHLNASDGPATFILRSIRDADRGFWTREPDPAAGFFPGEITRGRCWLDEDGVHVWWAHDCTTERVATMLPWPTWQALPNGQVMPSLDCDKCGCHTHYKIEWEIFRG